MASVFAISRHHPGYKGYAREGLLDGQVANLRGDSSSVVQSWKASGTGMNQKYWDDLTAEGRALTRVAEGEARHLTVPLHIEDRAGVRKLAEDYRSSVADTRYRDPDRPEHRLQDVVDAYRWMYPHASRCVGPRGVVR